MSAKKSNSPVTDGRFNLEQQRKRAKELLKAARADDASAQERIAASLHAFPDTLKLADAQRVIALENGFPSWSRFKHHIEALNYASDHVGEIGDREMPTLHIRCGSDIQQGLKTAGFSGDFLEFADPFCLGPLSVLPLEEHIRSRARFISSCGFGITKADALARQRKEYAALESLEAYRRIVLWFERDTYDQLILAYLLMRLGELQPDAIIELIAVDHVPGVERFIGIGQLAPELLAWLWRQREPIGVAHFALGARVWEALTAATPEPLFAIATAGTPEVPMMAGALLRHLQELPELQTGLSLTERLAMEILRDRGPLTLGRCYGELMREREPLPWLGDAMFGWIVRSMAQGSAPLITITPVNGEFWFQDIAVLTPIGERILAGEANRLDLNPVERWVGGIATPGDGGSWCWDRQQCSPAWRAYSGL